MKKLLIISPHFSTGGAPAVTENKIRLLKDSFQIKVIEHNFLSWIHVVQRNQVIEMVGGNNFHTLGDDKTEDLRRIMEEFQPEVISMEEFPEFFMSSQTANLIYNPDRK